jgi:hypothetical protein
MGEEMNFYTAFYQSIQSNRCFRRIGHHFSLFYVPETGDLHTGYNNETYQPTLEDVKASDWILE